MIKKTLCFSNPIYLTVQLINENEEISKLV